MLKINFNVARMVANERQMAESTGARSYSHSRRLSDPDVFAEVCSRGFAILPRYLHGPQLASLQAAAQRALPPYASLGVEDGRPQQLDVLPAANAVPSSSVDFPCAPTRSKCERTHGRKPLMPLRSRCRACAVVTQVF